MRKPVSMAGKVLLIFFTLFILDSVFAQERITVPRVRGNFNLQMSVSEWSKRFGGRQYLYTASTGTRLQIYSGYDQDNLYLGFLITDPYLTFEDDYSKEFDHSDHLRVRLKVKKEQEEKDLVFYILPTSKIKEPLLKIAGLSWRRSAFKVHSSLQSNTYFAAVAVSLEEIGVYSLPGETIAADFLLNDVTPNGAVKKIWLAREKAVDDLILVFNN